MLYLTSWQGATLIRNGLINSNGVLICDVATQKITHCSHTVDAFFKYPPETLLGDSLNVVFDRSLLHEINNVLGSSMSETSRISVVNHTVSGTPFRIFLQRDAAHIVIEIEPIHTLMGQPEDLLQDIHSLLYIVQTQDGLDNIMNMALQGIRRICGMDRVVWIRCRDKTAVLQESQEGPFLSSLTQKALSVEGEDLDRKAQRLLNLRSDHINDMRTPALQWMSQEPEARLPLVSKTMVSGDSFVDAGVLKSENIRATQTLALTLRNHLWGVIECHHTKPMSLHPFKRQVLSLFTEALSLQIQAKGLL